MNVIEFLGDRARLYLPVYVFAYLSPVSV